MKVSCDSITIFGFFINVVTSSREKQLITRLLNRYATVGQVGRPVNETDDKLVVEYGLTLVQILDLDERNQVLTTNIWGTYRWKDNLMTWDTAEYGNISSIRVPRDRIWMPDIRLYNYADERLNELREALAVVYSDGTILWVPQAIYKSSCKIDITYFPFDEQECYMKFGSWTYDGDKLDVEFFENYTGFDLTDYIASNEWEIVKHSAKKNVKYYVCCPEPYPDLRFTLKLRRKVAFYNYILILPCVLLSSLTLVLFWLPPESPAKMQLGMNIFVAFFVLLLLLAESTPPAASSIPLIGAYYCLNMIMITLSTFLSVVVVNLYFHGNRSRVPLIVKKIMINLLARLLCMHSQVKHVSTTKDKELEETANNATTEIPRFAPFVYEKVGGGYEMHKEDKWKLVSNGTLGQGLDTDSPTYHAGSPVKAIENLEGEVREIRRYVTAMSERLLQKESMDYIGKEWKVVALVLDRIFFFVYLAAIVVSVFTIFPRAKSSTI